MEKLTGCWLLLAALSFALAQDKVTSTYFKDGGVLTMDVRPTSSEPLYNILWKINDDLVAEWIKDQVTGSVLVPLTYYRSFRNRTTLDLTTGRLVINNMTKADTGVYSVELNNKVQNEKYNAVLIKEVPQPEVEPTPLTCSPASDSCTLVCHGDVTDAGPVTYSWKMGDGEWKVSGKNLDITKSETSDVETFTCRIQNPVSERDSKPKRNPLLEKESGTSGDGGVVGPVIGCLLGGGGAGAFICYILKKKNKFCFQNRGSSPAGESKPNAAAAKNAEGGPPASPATADNNADKPEETIPLTNPPKPEGQGKGEV